MIYYGFDEVLYGWDRYFDLCNAFEVRNPRDPDKFPSDATLNRWRVDSPRGFAWILHAVPEMSAALVNAYEAGTTELGDAFHAAIERTEKRAHALSAKAILLETPPGFPPSDVSRGLVRALGQAWSEQTKRALIWESSGLWTAEDGRNVAADSGFVYAVDPFIIERDELGFGRGGDAAFRVTERAAARRHFDAWEMEKLVGWSDAFDRTFVLLSGRYKIPHAKELSLLLQDQRS
jgi:hypothetical protein